MPRVNVRVFNTQLSRDTFNAKVDATTVQDIMDAEGFNFNPSSVYVDGTTKQKPFESPTDLVSRDITLFESPKASKAGA